MFCFDQSRRRTSIPAGSFIIGRRLLLLCLLAVMLSVVSLAGGANQRLDINRASASELAERLPGVGPVKAQAIVAYREANGAFSAVDELLNVRGIGPATLEKLRPLITVTSGSVVSDEPLVGSSGSSPDTSLSPAQMEAMARVATRAAIRLAIEDARSVGSASESD